MSNCLSRYTLAAGKLIDDPQGRLCDYSSYQFIFREYSRVAEDNGDLRNHIKHLEEQLQALQQAERKAP